MMKVITIQQPWASLIILGAKQIETRSWATKYRGPILIHASAGFPRVNRELCAVEPFWSYLRDYLRDFGPLPTGTLLGRANLKDIESTEDLLLDFEQWPGIYGVNEKYFGDYSQGRYGWTLEDVEPFERPIPAKGKLGLWEYPDDKLTIKK